MKEKIMDITVKEVIETLKGKRAVFFSEDDFKFAIAGEIKQKYPDSEIFLEYCFDGKKYLDILVLWQKHTYPIELKYKTKELVVEGKINSVDVEFKLKKQGASTNGRYDFLKG
jgi:hypothetical protein